MMKLKANQTEQAQQAREAFEKAQSELGDVDDEEGLETWSQEDVLVKVNQMKEDNKRRLSNTFKERSMPIWQEPVLNKVQVCFMIEK